MSKRTDARRHVVDATPGFRRFDDFRHRAEFRFRTDDKGVGLAAHVGNMREAALWIEPGIGADKRFDRVVGRARNHQRVSVRRGLRCRRDTYEPAAAGAVIDDDGCAEHRRQLVG